MNPHRALIRLDDAMLQNVVGLGVNPFYHHDTRRERPEEVALCPHLDCQLRRSPFDARIQLAFQQHCVQLQQPLVETGVGFYSVITDPLAQSRKTGIGLQGTFDKYIERFMPDEDSSASTKKRQRTNSTINIDCRPPFKD